MKTKVAISVFACCLLAVFFIMGFKNSQNTILSKHTVNTALSNLDNPSLQQRVASLEYHIHFNNEIKAFSAPNRQNNLRFTFNKKGFSAKTRDRNIQKIDLDETKAKESLKNKKNNDLPEAQMAFELKNFGKLGCEIGFENP